MIVGTVTDTVQQAPAARRHRSFIVYDRQNQFCVQEGLSSRFCS